MNVYQLTEVSLRRGATGGRHVEVEEPRREHIVYPQARVYNPVSDKT